ncbi:hypothetical protein MTO96_002599 [Rhipicephalus appendiculatus]
MELGMLINRTADGTDDSLEEKPWERPCRAEAMGSTPRFRLLGVFTLTMGHALCTPFLSPGLRRPKGRITKQCFSHASLFLLHGRTRGLSHGGVFKRRSGCPLFAIPEFINCVVA